jgi:hypothetical protein
MSRPDFVRHPGARRCAATFSSVVIAVDDARHGSPGSLVEEVLPVERNDLLRVRLGRAVWRRPSSPRGRRRPSPSSDTTSIGLVQDWLLVNLEELGQPGALGAHGTVSSASAAISKSRRIWAG